MSSPATVLSITALNRLARESLEQQLPLMWVAGEISNFTQAASGHLYFSLKDAQAQVRAVMFRHKAQYLDFRPGHGVQVEALVLPTLFEARGEFQLQVENLRPAGLGRLYALLEQRKQQLEARGLFDPARKRALPVLPRRIGVATSLQAAALRDVLTTLQRRHAGIPVVVYPTPVQGDGAEIQIAAAIRMASSRAEVDVLLIVRGGGSLEDLWCFNSIEVVEAIAASVVPTISGIGHETDFTLADLVADVRAPTPTAAAELACPDARLWMNDLVRLRGRLQRALNLRLDQASLRLDYLSRRLIHPAQQLEQQQQRLLQLSMRLRRAQQQLLPRQQQRVDHLQHRLERARPDLFALQQPLLSLALRLERVMEHQLEAHEQHCAHLAGALEQLNPLAVLRRGYALVELRHKPVSSARQLRPGQSVELVFADGRQHARIEAGMVDLFGGEGDRQVDL